MNQYIQCSNSQEMVTILHQNTSYYELDFTSKQTGIYYHLILGRHSYGNFLCIPNHDIGCEISRLSDIFWNAERLSKHLSKEEAKLIAHTIAQLKSKS